LIPREEPPDTEPPPPQEVSPPTLEIRVVEYDALRDGCADDTAIDAELAIQAEVVRVAIGRRTGKPPEK